MSTPSRRWATMALAALAALGASQGLAQGQQTQASEAALGLTRRLPSDYLKACVEILREVHVNACPPLVPDGGMQVRGDGDSLDVVSGVLSTIDGHDIDAHGGHWTIWVTNDWGGRQTLADHMHATGSKTPSQCRFLQLEGQRVEACRVPPYPDGGYYGNHIAYGWQRGGVVYNITMHNHANEPRLRLMVAALIKQQQLPPQVRARFGRSTVTRCPDGAADTSQQPDSTTHASDRLSSGRIVLTCRTVESLAAMAYVQYADGLAHSRWAVGSSGATVTGGASWLRTDAYTIEAEAPISTSREMMLGPTLQTLLEDRFKLKVHREHRDVPFYELTKGDTWYTKLRPLEFKEGTCIPLDSSREGDDTTLGAGQRRCASSISSTATGSRLDLEGATLGGLAKFLTAQPFIDRRVRDRVGYPARYDFHLEFSPVAGAQSHETARASLFAVIGERLGMPVEPAIGEAEFLVIDRAERPNAKAPGP